MPQQHSIFEDLFALLSGSVATSLGIFLFTQVGMVTGGTTGAALLLTHVTSFSFGQLFFLINLPFYALAFMNIGKRFTLNTFIAILLTSALTDHLHLLINVGTIEPLYAAIAGGLLIGMGILVLVRHNASLGGFTVLALFLQDKFDIRAGYSQMTLDCTLIVSGFFLVTPWLLLVSVIGAVILNMTLALNHKPGRYQVSRA